MMNDLISSFVLPFEHLYSEENPRATVIIYVNPQNRKGKKTFPSNSYDLSHLVHISAAVCLKI